MPTFDLGMTRGIPAVRFQNTARWFIAAVFLFLVASTVWGILDTIRLGLLDVRHIVILALVLVVDALFGLILNWVSPQADQITVEEGYIRLMFRCGRARAISLSKPSLELRLRSTPGSPDKISRGSPIYMLIDEKPSRTFLTKEAFEEILRVARESGLSVLDEPCERPGWKIVALRASTQVSPPS